MIPISWLVLNKILKMTMSINILRYKIIPTRILEDKVNYGHRGTDNGSEYLSFNSVNNLNIGCGDIIQHLLLKMNVGKVRAFHAAMKNVRVEEVVENSHGYVYKIHGKVLPRSDYEYKFEKRDILKNNILDGRS